MTVDTHDIDKTIAAIESEYGQKMIHKGSESQRFTRIPFPSLELNIASGGGIPTGRIARLFGNYSSGKTLTSLGLIKNAQNIHIIAQQMLESKFDSVKNEGEKILEMFPEGMTCAYYNVEKVYDNTFAQKIGVDTDKLYVVEGSRIEPMAEIIEAAFGSIHLHVIDSASAAVSLDELASNISDWHRGIKARVWGKVLDHLEDKIDNSENAILILDQIRIDQTSGAPYAPGGEKLEHVSSLTTHLKRGKWLFRRGGTLKAEAEQNPKTLSGSPEADGFEVMARVTKSRVGRPFRSARMHVDFENMGFDQLYEQAKAATYLGIVKQAGAWYTLPNGEKVQGQNGLAQEISENVELKQEILDKASEYIWLNP